MTSHNRCDETAIVELARDGLTNEQIAARVGVTVRTLARWRAARPDMNAAINATRAQQRDAALRPCGTYAAYRRGCHCELCRAANRREASARLARRRTRPVPDDIHGKATTYGNWGCRCRPCTDAHTIACAPHSRAYDERKRQLRQVAAA